MNRPPGWGPGHPEYEARVAADMAKLQGAKGIQIRAWLRENKVFALILGIWLGGTLIGVLLTGNPLIGALAVPLIAFKVYARSIGRKPRW